MNVVVFLHILFLLVAALSGLYSFLYIKKVQEPEEMGVALPLFGERLLTIQVFLSFFVAFVIGFFIIKALI